MSTTEPHSDPDRSPPDQTPVRIVLQDLQKKAGELEDLMNEIRPLLFEAFLPKIQRYDELLNEIQALSHRL